MNGWIKIHRTMLQWEHFNEPSVVTVFLALLLNADKGGQTEISLGGLSSATGLTINTVRCALAKLVESGEITREFIKGQKTTTTIANWSKYQVYQKTIHRDNEGISKIDTPVYQKLIHTVSKNDTPHIINSKNNKKEQENIVVANAHTHTRERLIAEANVDLRIEQGCRSLGVDPATYQELLDAVINDWEFTNVPDEEWTMFHLLQTMRIKNNIKKRENNGQAQNGNNRQPVAAGRADRAAAVAATMAALGAAGAQTESLPY